MTFAERQLTSTAPTTSRRRCPPPGAPVGGDDVTMYHRVTLGGRGWWADSAGSRRRPAVGDRVVLGVGVTVLGPVHVGDDASLGAHCLVLHDVPAGARPRAPAAAPVPPPAEAGPAIGPVPFL